MGVTSGSAARIPSSNLSDLGMPKKITTFQLGNHTVEVHCPACK